MKRTNLKGGFAPIAIVVILVVAVALGGGVYYSVKKNQAPEGENQPTSSPTPLVNANADAEATFGIDVQTGTLRSLLALGRDVECTVSSDDTSSGTVYISGSMMRGDFSSSASSGAIVESHMIRNGDSVLVWSGSQGAKMSMSQMNANASAQGNASVNLDQSVNYTCENWTKDTAKFTTPSAVNFVDIGAMMNVKGAI